jgi:hypothetical protein
MAIDPAALATEIQQDADALGYAASVVAGNDQAVADALNLVRAGATFQVSREPISTAFFLSNVAPAEFLALTAVKLAQLQCIVAAQSVDINDASTQAMLVGIFGNPSATRTAIIAILKRQGSRAEALFGRGAVVSASDVSKALRGL